MPNSEGSLLLPDTQFFPCVQNSYLLSLNNLFSNEILKNVSQFVNHSATQEVVLHLGGSEMVLVSAARTLPAQLSREYDFPQD